MLTLLLSIPGAYLNAGIVCYFIWLIQRRGTADDPGSGWGWLRPLGPVALWGVVPGAILGNLLALFGSTFAGSLVFAIGALVSAVMLQRLLMARVHRPDRWNLAILVLTVAIMALSGSFLSAPA